MTIQVMKKQTQSKSKKKKIIIKNKQKTNKKKLYPGKKKTFLYLYTLYSLLNFSLSQFERYI